MGTSPTGASFGESEAHKEQKRKAIKFLEALGCEQIETEKTLGRRRQGRQKYIVVDVAGYFDGKLIVVECGGIAVKGKASRLKVWMKMGKIASVFILPYGENEPYLWADNIKVCPACGHKI